MQSKILNVQEFFQSSIRTADELIENLTYDGLRDFVDSIYHFFENKKVTYTGIEKDLELNLHRLDVLRISPRFCSLLCGTNYEKTYEEIFRYSSVRKDFVRSLTDIKKYLIALSCLKHH